MLKFDVNCKLNMEEVSDFVTPDDIKDAEAILKVSGVLPDEKFPPPISVGEKLLRPLGTEDEFARVELFNSERHHHNMQMKAERLGNLAIAEWLPQLQVAKVIKQNKSTNTAMTLNHIEKFMFLFAEEALYLLDSKSLELRLNGTPMAIDEAFSVLTCSSRTNVNDLLCTLKEYYVFSWFMKAGFAIQRHSMPPIVRKPEPKPLEIKDQSTNKDDVKADQDSAKTSEVKQNENVGTSTNKDDEKNDVKEEQNSVNNTPEGSNRNFSSRELWSIVPDYSLVIDGLDWECLPLPECAPVEDQYYVRRNQRAQQKNQLFNLRYREEIKVAQKAKTWKQYKTQLAALKDSRRRENRMKAAKMSKGKTKPLINSQNDYHSTRQVLQNLDIFRQCSIEGVCQGSTFAFNVYKKNKSFSNTFSKINPGVPFCRVVISNSNSPLLSSSQMSQLSSDNVRIKIAMVEGGGSVTFFGVDCVEIPKSVFTE